MCGIAGIISKDGSDVSEQIEKMLKILKHRGPDGCGLMIGNKIQRGFSIDDLDFNEKGYMALGHTRLAIVGGLSGQQPLQDCQNKLTLIHNGEIYNYREIRKKLEHKHNFVTETDSETIVHLIEDYYKGNLEKAVSKALPQLDGVYALAVTDGEEIVIARDMIGVKQLYVGKNEKYFAFASERKALWEVGMDDEKRLCFGHLAKLSKNRVITRKVLEPPVNQETQIHDLHEALNVYHRYLVEAVRKRVAGLERVGVIFSGG